MTIRVLLADDDALLRAGLAVVIGTAADLVLVAEAADGLQAVELARRHVPDVILMDVRMPGIDGIEATRRLTVAQPQTRILILTTFQHDEYVWGALRAGASGFLLKRASPERLLDAIRTVAAGEALLDPGVTRDLIERYIAIANGDAPDRAADPSAQRTLALSPPANDRSCCWSARAAPTPRSQSCWSSPIPPPKPMSSEYSPRSTHETARRPWYLRIGVA